MSNSKNRKFIFITGGVVSSLGKGIIASSLGLLFKERGFAVTIQKLDPYLNVDPGTMNPYQHGEVFVTADGAETDLDLGHYERFIDRNLLRVNNVTAGSIYSAVLQKERQGDYLGGTVQMVPQVSNEIKARIHSAVEQTDSEIVIVEVGGTVGDIESLIFLESIRQMKKDVGANNTAYIHVTLVPNLSATNELKTKPTQHSVEMLRSKGIIPDILICRSDKSLSEQIKQKLSLFTDVSEDSVIECLDAKSIYEVPLNLEAQGLIDRLSDKLALPARPCDLTQWKSWIDKLKNPQHRLKIGIIGKYINTGDAYISVVEALRHAAVAERTYVKIEMISAESLCASSESTKDEAVAELLADLDGIVVPGGFGDRGIEGKIATVEYAREHKLPFLGLCLGMQCAVIEFARNVLKFSRANSTEFDPETAYPVIDFLPGQSNELEKGGTMRLGNYPCKLQSGSQAQEAYGADAVLERHRHRYEFNNTYLDSFRKAGLSFSGLSPDQKFVEIVELPLGAHPFFVGTQFHPEYRSRPLTPHPIFRAMIKAILAKKQG